MIERVCQGCRKTQDRDLMIKITKLESNLLKINPSSNELGRSIYVCKNIDCIKNIIKKHKLKTSLKCNNLNEVERVEQELIGLFSAK